jgi:hypothetical protein
MLNPSSGYDPSVWSNFFSAEAGASATLTGLIFVAVSINLSKIVAMRLLIARAAKALFTLIGVLLASTLCMAPGQSPKSLGWELSVTGVIVWLLTSICYQAATRHNQYVELPQKIYQLVLTELSALPFIAGGVTLILGAGGGLYWLLAGTVFSFVAALLDAWVLLIEIHR